MMSSWSRITGIVPYAMTVFLYAYHLRILWSMFAAGNFGYHDLTLINDWLTNGIYQGRPFYVTDTDSYHLAYNFTPSLLLLSPFYYLTNSQFVLVFLGLTSLYSAFLVLLGLFRELARPFLGRLMLDMLSTAFIILCCQNEYTKLVLQSAHFEVLFVLPAVIVIRVLILKDDPSWFVLLPVTLLALGIRQDAGLYLGCLLVGLFFVRPVKNRAFAVRVGILISICVLYMLVAITGVMPALGYTDGLRFWKHLGDSPFAIIQALVSNPAQSWRELQYSALLPLNRSFDYYHLFNPFAVTANAPVLPMYFVKTADFGRKYLLLYNASFPLAGFYVALLAGLVTLVKVIARFREVSFIHRLMTILLVACLLSSIHSLYRSRERLPPARKAAYRIMQENRLGQFEEFRRALELRRPDIRSFASDFHTLTFVPNDRLRFSRHNFEKAEVVVVDLRLRRSTPDYIAPRDSIRKLEQHGLREIYRQNNYAAYARSRK